MINQDSVKVKMPQYMRGTAPRPGIASAKFIAVAGNCVRRMFRAAPSKHRKKHVANY